MAIAFRPLPGLTIATLVALAILIGLGTWQLQRRVEKHALLDQIASRQNAPPAPIEILLATGDYAAHRPAIAQGTFEHASESYVYAPRPNEGSARPGFKVITPLRLASGGLILVDRGWVDERHKLPESRKTGQSEGETEIEGRLRPSSRPSTFTPPPDAASSTFYQRDSQAIAKALELELASALILEATTRVEGGPEPLASELVIPDNHLQYAITWFALAVVLVIIYLSFHAARGRLKVGR